MSQRMWLERIFNRYGIKTVCDVGAGDLNWVSHMNLEGIHYIPLDLVPRHPSVRQFDITKERPPFCDAILCLWVLNHLAFDDCRKALFHLTSSGARYLIMTYRESVRQYQPDEVDLSYIDSLQLNKKGDYIRLIEL